MPKDYFSLPNSASLDTVPSGGRIHIIGVSGVAMAQLACALAKGGFAVSGSDIDFWEPMGGLLKRSSVKLHSGYAAENVPPDVQLAVIGNAISYGNAEVAAVESSACPYSLFPKLLGELVIKDRYSIVVAGTHGKTTTTALAAYVLRSLGVDPAWFFGAAALQLDESLHVAAGNVSVVEGDEYDSAFFAKVPKFVFYKPKTLIVTSLEFDHADIYADIKSIEKEFTNLICSMPDSGRVLVCDEAPLMRELTAKWRSLWHGTVLTYGCEQSDFALLERRQRGGRQTFEIRDLDGRLYTASSPLGGRYNAQNATAIFAACLLLGLPAQEILEGISAFEGVKRRQERLDAGAEIVLIEDFAHHPTAVLKTLEGVKELYPNRRLWAVFEPRSNTTRRRIFQNEYISALSCADLVALSDVVARHNDVGIELLDTQAICAALKQRGCLAESFADYASLKEYLVANAQPEDVIVMMSNGAFGGIIPLVADELRRHFSQE